MCNGSEGTRDPQHCHVFKAVCEREGLFEGSSIALWAPNVDSARGWG